MSTIQAHVDSGTMIKQNLESNLFALHYVEVEKSKRKENRDSDLVKEKESSDNGEGILSSESGDDAKINEVSSNDKMLINLDSKKDFKNAEADSDIEPRPNDCAPSKSRIYELLLMVFYVIEKEPWTIDRSRSKNRIHELLLMSFFVACTTTTEIKEEAEGYLRTRPNDRAPSKDKNHDMSLMNLFVSKKKTRTIDRSQSKNRICELFLMVFFVACVKTTEAKKIFGYYSNIGYLNRDWSDGIDRPIWRKQSLPTAFLPHRNRRRAKLSGWMGCIQVDADATNDIDIEFDVGKEFPHYVDDADDGGIDNDHMINTDDGKKDLDAREKELVSNFEIPKVGKVLCTLHYYFQEIFKIRRTKGICTNSYEKKNMEKRTCQNLEANEMLNKRNVRVGELGGFESFFTTANTIQMGYPIGAVHEVLKYRNLKEVSVFDMETKICGGRDRMNSGAGSDSENDYASSDSTESLRLPLNQGAKDTAKDVECDNLKDFWIRKERSIRKHKDESEGSQVDGFDSDDSDNEQDFVDRKSDCRSGEPGIIKSDDSDGRFQKEKSEHVSECDNIVWKQLDFAKKKRFDNVFGDGINEMMNEEEGIFCEWIYCDEIRKVKTKNQMLFLDREQEVNIPTKINSVELEEKFELMFLERKQEGNKPKTFISGIRNSEGRNVEKEVNVPTKINYGDINSEGKDPSREKDNLNDYLGCDPERDKLNDYLGSDPERDKFERKLNGIRNSSAERTAEEIRTKIGRMLRSVFTSCIYSGYFSLTKIKLERIILERSDWLRESIIRRYGVSTKMTFG